MIKFPCKCGHVFNLTEDMAGGLAQCPRCGLLADVPSMNDVANITEEGIFKIDDAIPLTDEISVPELREAFTRSTVHADGRQIDLRPDEEHYRRIGVPKEVDNVGFAPKYDPASGELIRPLEIKEAEPELEPVPLQVISIDDPASDVVPLTAVPAEPVRKGKPVSYATAETRTHTTPLTVMLELFMPGNVVVMLFIFLFYVLAEKVAGILAVGGTIFRVMPILNIPLWLILAHYGCVIEEIGPDSADELPRPFRHLQSREDLVNPFLSVTLALLLCYFPVLIAAAIDQRLGHLAAPIMLAFALLGSFFLPAVVLTSVTGSTVANLRLDRLIGVIKVLGADYLLAVAVLLFALIPLAVIPIVGAMPPSKVTDFILAHADEPYVVYPTTATMVYLMHFLCWHLGLMYRAHHSEFPWIMQEHAARRDPVYAPPRQRQKKTV